MKKPFIFLDRDGTLIVEGHYLCDPDDVKLLPGVVEGLRKLRELGFGLAVVTNQSGIGRGYFTETQMRAVHDRMRELLAAEDVTIDGIFFCPHTPDDNCACRKPLPGLLQTAQRELHFDLSNSFVVGDKTCDVDLGRHAGMKAFLVRTGYGAQHEAENLAQPDYVVDDLVEMARMIEHLLQKS